MPPSLSHMILMYPYLSHPSGGGQPDSVTEAFPIVSSWFTLYVILNPVPDDFLPRPGRAGGRRIIFAPQRHDQPIQAVVVPSWEKGWKAAKTNTTTAFHCY